MPRHIHGVSPGWTRWIRRNLVPDDA